MELKTGSADSTLDEKGRINISVNFRDQFQGKLFMTRGMEPCVWIMTPSAWEQFERNLRKKKYTPKVWRQIEYKYLHHKHEVEIDKAGRIAIPPPIREYANLTRECIVISAGNRLSVWDSGTFNEYCAETDPIVEEAISELGSQDIFEANQAD
ncbi:MAG: division/cell wall cluster transcriptional repressor MraZ [Treponema sp.]|jgi:MraZ protein|nr:division/cell wall cluster transcriptional repressor MraZ [Treponema sp.]